MSFILNITYTKLSIKVDTAGTKSCSKEMTPNMPCPADLDWTNPNEWKPLWPTLPQASQSSCEVLCCGWKKGCRDILKHMEAALKCTTLCPYGGVEEISKSSCTYEHLFNKQHKQIHTNTCICACGGPGLRLVPDLWNTWRILVPYIVFSET